MARRTIFNATFCCGNMLQQFEVDSNCCNIVARTLSELVRVTPSPSTFNATLYQNTPRESRNKSRDQSTSEIFSCQQKNGGDCWQWSRSSRHNLYQKHVFMATIGVNQSLSTRRNQKLLNKAAKEQKETALKDLEEHFDFNYTSDELVGVWKSLRACMLREVKRTGKDTASS